MNGWRACHRIHERMEPLSDALIDDRSQILGQSVDIGLSRPEIAALLSVVEETVDTVPVLTVVLAGVDSALGGNGVGTTRCIVIDEYVDAVPLGSK